MALATAELYSFTKALSFFSCSKNCDIAASLMDHLRQTGMRLKGVPATGKDVRVFHLEIQTYSSCSGTVHPRDLRHVAPRTDSRFQLSAGGR